MSVIRDSNYGNPSQGQLSSEVIVHWELGS